MELFLKQGSMKKLCFLIWKKTFWALKQMILRNKMSVDFKKKPGHMGKSWFLDIFHLGFYCSQYSSLNCKTRDTDIGLQTFPPWSGGSRSYVYNWENMLRSICPPHTLLVAYTIGCIHYNSTGEGSNLSEISEYFQNFGGLLSLRISKWGRLQSLRILDFYVKKALLWLKKIN